MKFTAICTNKEHWLSVYNNGLSTRDPLEITWRWEVMDVVEYVDGVGALVTTVRSENFSFDDTHGAANSKEEAVRAAIDVHAALCGCELEMV